MRRTSRSHRDLLVCLLEMDFSLPLQEVENRDSIQIRFPTMALANHVAVSLRI